VVTGGIIPCSALPLQSGPHYAAGTVTILKGQVRGTAAGASGPAFPETVVAAHRVAVNATYRFTLKPGRYVLQANFPPPGNEEPRVDITVRAGQTLRQDIPNVCI
jgi:hypothetical protein